VENRDLGAVRGEVVGDRLLADRAGAPGTLVGGRLAEAEEEVADVGMGLAGGVFTAGAAALVLAADGGGGGAEVGVVGVGHARSSARRVLTWN
jgi:hypothetical protein